jgi:outer membrane beta-barrel protein
MESRNRILLLTHALAWLVVAWGGSAAAQDDTDADGMPVVAPELTREEVTVASIDTENFEVGIYGGLMSVEDFGVNSVTGLRFAYHITEDWFLESAYGMTTTEETSFERLSGSAQLLTEDQRDYTYYNLSVGYNVLPGEAFVNRNVAFNTALYLIAGLGSTEFAGDDRRTLNFGAGYRFLAKDWVALHLDVRDHVFDIDVTGEDKETHNIEVHGGITFFF